MRFRRGLQLKIGTRTKGVCAASVCVYECVCVWCLMQIFKPTNSFQINAHQLTHTHTETTVISAISTNLIRQSGERRRKTKDLGNKLASDKQEEATEEQAEMFRQSIHSLGG